MTYFNTLKSSHLSSHSGKAGSYKPPEISLNKYGGGVRGVWGGGACICHGFNIQVEKRINLEVRINKTYTLTVNLFVILHINFLVKIFFLTQEIPFLAWLYCFAETIEKYYTLEMLYRYSVF